MPQSDYKPNSHKYHEAAETRTASTSESTEEPKAKTHVREHKSVGQRFKDTFFAESFRSVIEYILWDVLVPALKDMLLQFVETTLFGRSGSSYRSDRDRRSTSKTNYRRCSDRHDDRRSVRTRPARSFSIERFEFESRREAEDILSQMNEQCRKYDGVCPVSSFYDFIDYDRPADWTHDRWGWSWDALDRARIIRKSNGWFALSIAEPDTYID